MLQCIEVLMFFWTSVLGSFIYIPRSGIIGSKGRFIFHFLRYFHTAFHSGYTSLYSHLLCKRVLLSPHPSQRLFFDLMVIAILTLRWLHYYFCKYVNNLQNICSYVYVKIEKLVKLFFIFLILFSLDIMKHHAKREKGQERTRTSLCKVHTKEKS